MLAIDKKHTQLRAWRWRSVILQREIRKHAGNQVPRRKKLRRFSSDNMIRALLNAISCRRSAHSPCSIHDKQLHGRSRMWRAAL